MIEENISQESGFENIDKARNYFLKEIQQNELMSNKKVYLTLNYIKHFLILASAFTGFISISPLPSLFGIPIGVTFCNRIKNFWNRNYRNQSI